MDLLSQDKEVDAHRGLEFPGSIAELQVLWETLSQKQ